MGRCKCIPLYHNGLVNLDKVSHINHTLGTNEIFTYKRNKNDAQIQMMYINACSFYFFKRKYLLETGLVVLNSLSFCLSEKLLISHSYLNEILAGYNNLGCRLFSFIILSMSCHSLLAWRVSIERSAVILMGIPLCVICCFSLAAFNICSSCSIFVNLINMCLGVFHLGFILFGTLWVSWT